MQKNKHSKIVVAAVLIIFVLAMGVNIGSVLAASPSGYLAMPDQVNPGGSGTKSGTFGTFDLPGKGQVAIHYEDVHATSHMQHFVEPLSADFLALGYNTGGPTIPFVYQQDAAIADGTVTYAFERAWSNLSFVIVDVDTDDLVTVAAIDEEGNAITDFSDWIVVGSGDATTSNPSGGTKPTPAPNWNPALGQISSGTPGENTSRSYIVLQPDVAIQQLSYHLAAPGSGSHIYTTIWSYSTPELSIGNEIWYDTNNNGVFDLGEAPIVGVLVELLDALGNVLDTAVTDGSGHYRFDDLPEGRYQVRVAGSNFSSGGALEGHRSSLYEAEPPSTDNPRLTHIDVGTEGINLTADGVSSGFFDLFYDAGSETDGDVLRWTYFSADFGFVLVQESASSNDGDDTETLANTGSLTAVSITASSLLIISSLATIVRGRFSYNRVYVYGSGSRLRGRRTLRNGADRGWMPARRHQVQ